MGLSREELSFRQRGKSFRQSTGIVSLIGLRSLKPIIFTRGSSEGSNGGMIATPNAGKDEGRRGIEGNDDRDDGEALKKM